MITDRWAHFQSELNIQVRHSHTSCLTGHAGVSTIPDSEVRNSRTVAWTGLLVRQSRCVRPRARVIHSSKKEVDIHSNLPERATGSRRRRSIEGPGEPDHGFRLYGTGVPGPYPILSRTSLA